MDDQSTISDKSQSPLAIHLSNIRIARGLTLRQVEEKTNKAVSNAYLSQIEKGKIQKPSPNVLHALARVYQASYDQMMDLAGYKSAKKSIDPAFSRAATFAALNLSEQEQDEMIEYIKWKRSMKPKEA